MAINPNERLRGLLREFTTAVIITHDGVASLRARPMAIAAVDDNCDLWFVTGRDSAKVHEIEKDTHILAVCQNGWTSTVSIAGRASLSDDRAKIQELWRPSYNVWFPRGVNDPDAILIHLAGTEAEYWDNTGMNCLTYAYQAAKAMMTHTKPKIREGEQHGHVSLS